MDSTLQLAAMCAVMLAVLSFAGLAPAFTDLFTLPVLIAFGFGLISAEALYPAMRSAGLVRRWDKPLLQVLCVLVVLWFQGIITLPYQMQSDIPGAPDSTDERAAITVTARDDIQTICPNGATFDEEANNCIYTPGYSGVAIHVYRDGETPSSSDFTIRNESEYYTIPRRFT